MPASVSHHCLVLSCHYEIGVEYTYVYTMFIHCVSNKMWCLELFAVTSSTVNRFLKKILPLFETAKNFIYKINIMFCAKKFDTAFLKTQCRNSFVHS